MRTRSVVKTITRDPTWLGPAIHPGEMLLEEFLAPLGLGQVEAARRLGMSLNRLNELVLGKRGVTADTRNASSLWWIAREYAMFGRCENTVKRIQGRFLPLRA